MAAAFEPESVERGVVAWWGRQELRPKRESGKVFSMVIPPPNVTGKLHIGHALTVTVQDSLVRWRKMRGDEVVWVPGVDHAGIATQSVVERNLLKEDGLTRHDLGRERFVQTIWDWYEKYNGTIDGQLHRLGALLNWDRKVFTLDEVRSEAVIKAFVELHARGLVRRDVRLVNWCPHLRTVISDLETEHEELAGPTKLRLPGRDASVEFGVMHEFAYPVHGADDGAELVVSTTRLETMFGDTGVAVHPDDPRYKDLHGKFLDHPFLPDRRIPVVLDEALVDMELGTGAVKVTPAHDENDFACGRRHGLAELSILNKDGTLNEVCGPEWAGVDRFEARAQIAERLKALGLYRGKKPHAMRLARCSRSGDVIEPMLLPQWFVNCDGMAARALEQVRSGALAIEPAQHVKTWEHFLGNIRDWCISRQLWWGHRIPAYRVVAEGVAEDTWVVAATRDAAAEQAARDYGLAPESFSLEQDEDVLDTWFSSGLFPLSALDWPRDSFLARAYPLSLMETGSDILFFWVARMAMLCSELHPEGTLPFNRVFLHPMIRDKQGRKMSKSLGNVIDPLHVIQGTTLDTLLEGLQQGNLDPREVKKASANLKKEFPDGVPASGTDALRLALASYMHSGSHINLDVARVTTWRLFGNKLWNAVRFARMQEPVVDAEALASAPLPLECQWILRRLDRCVARVESGMQTVNLAAVTQAVQEFVVSDLCDVYLEVSKYSLQQHEDAVARSQALRVLVECLEVSMRLMHPLAPFITEELWHRLLAGQVAQSVPALDPASVRNAYAPTESIASQPFPAPGAFDAVAQPGAEEDMQTLIDAVGAARGLRDALKGVLERGVLDKEVHLVHAADASGAPAQGLAQVLCERNLDLVRFLLRVDAVKCVPAAEAQAMAGLERSVRPGLSVRFPVALRPEDAPRISAESARLGKRLRTAQRGVDKLEATLSSERYLARAPEEAQARDRARLEDARAAAAALQASIATLDELLSAARAE